MTEYDEVLVLDQKVFCVQGYRGRPQCGATPCALCAIIRVL